MPIVTFIKQGREIECPVGTNLRRLALDNEVDLYVFPNNIMNCRGNGLCGTCRVKVDNPRALSPRTRTEERKLGWEGEQFRLSCQVRVLADVQVTTNPRKHLGWMQHPTYQWLEGLE